MTSTTTITVHIVVKPWAIPVMKAIDLASPVLPRRLLLRLVDIVLRFGMVVRP